MTEEMSVASDRRSSVYVNLDKCSGVIPWILHVVIPRVCFGELKSGRVAALGGLRILLADVVINDDVCLSASRRLVFKLLGCLSSPAFEDFSSRWIMGLVCPVSAFSPFSKFDIVDWGDSRLNPPTPDCFFISPPHEGGASHASDPSVPMATAVVTDFL